MEANPNLRALQKTLGTNSLLHFKFEFSFIYDSKIRIYCNLLYLVNSSVRCKSVQVVCQFVEIRDTIQQSQPTFTNPSGQGYYVK